MESLTEQEQVRVREFLLKFWRFAVGRADVITGSRPFISLIAFLIIEDYLLFFLRSYSTGHAHCASGVDC